MSSLREGHADLHVHTYFSDGLHSPAEVVEMAVIAGLSWVSVTDHDTVDGLAEAASEAGRRGIGFVPGVEVSVEHDGQDFHLLGYWIDPADPGLQGLLAELAASRERRARTIVDRLHRLGVNIRFDEVRERAHSSERLGRPHVARALVSGGWVQSFPEAFARYLGKEAPAYVSKDPVEPARALRVIREAGGVPVLAHPGAYHLNGAWKLFLREGLQGLETEYPTHTPDQTQGFRRLADRHGLTRTGGSDFHGREISDSGVGSTRVEARVVDQLAARKEVRA